MASTSTKKIPRERRILIKHKSKQLNRQLKDGNKVCHEREISEKEDWAVESIKINPKDFL